MAVDPDITGWRTGLQLSHVAHQWGGQYDAQDNIWAHISRKDVVSLFERSVLVVPGRECTWLAAYDAFMAGHHHHALSL